MASCTSCGTDVTGKKFCPNCGNAVQIGATQTASSQNLTACPSCQGEVKPGATFCMHCGSALKAQVPAGPATPAPTPAMIACPACQAQVLASTTFCTQCGHDVRVQVAPQTAAGLCGNCGKQNEANVRFCGGCGNAIGGTGQYPQPSYAQAGSGQYPNPQPQYQQPSSPYQQYPSQPYSQSAYPSQYGQPQPQYPSQPYSQPQYPSQSYGQPQQPYPAQPYGQPQAQYPAQPYGQPGYPQPYGQQGYGQVPMVLHCPTCMATAPVGTQNCVGCRTSLVGVPPTPANMAAPGQQQQGGFFQGDKGKMAMGALGGAAAVIGGEMLLHGMENKIEDDVEFGRNRNRGGGLLDGLGGLGELGKDIGLF